MSNLATVTQLRPVERPAERRVAEIEDGYTRLANALYDELIGADLTKNQSKVAHAICRKTYGFGKKMDRISDSQLAQLTRLPRQKVNKAKNELIAMKVIKRDGHLIGPNKEISEWQIEGCHYSGDNVTAMVTKAVTKTVTALSPKQSHTKETITKENKETTPLPPGGGDGQVSKPEKRKAERIDYESFLNAYNTEVGDRLPHAVAVNEKRKRRLKKIIPQLKTPNVDGFRAYVRAFVHQAKPFYFGDNDTGWTADFDYLLREDSLTGVREGKFADRGIA
ncbi:replication protein [Cronobacter sakazakii]|uniref:replication protein n=1 Tax=Cronobacter sakazakii TaxID=28141 RepID=UPI0009BA8E95|nr:replication protein [Cronobacter sakazakii]EJD7746299.1 replication protein [Salmonella enterica]EGT4353129.1 DNA replication protein [Cronobacter sakazakii]EJQ0793512.1 replication protein [Cronobacter sakazakii]EJQ2916715.1 replication protein [Cronobacter sakazakii]EJR0496570.1 replication protein [Cronobacter sakazakii]